MKRLFCLIFGHKYRLKRNITSWLREVKCTRCKREFAMNDDVKCLMPLDDELIKMNNEILYG